MEIFNWTLGLVVSLLFTAFCISGILSAPAVVILYAFGLSLGLIATGACTITLIFGIGY